MPWTLCRHGVGPVAAVLLFVAGSPVAIGADGLPAEPARVIEGVTHGSRWLVDVRDGSAIRLPLSLRPVFATDYAVSPDGRRVVFAAPDPDGMLGTTRLYVARTDGTRVRPITPSGVAAWDPAWSPDGRKIVHVDVTGLAVLDLPTGRVRRFARLPAGSLERPSFRPDGRAILFTRTFGRRGLRSALWTVPALGGRARLLLDDAAYGAWSGDGSRLAFARRDNDRARRVLRELGFVNPYLVDTDPHGLWLADGEGAHRQRIAGDGWASWSPDGGRLVVGGDDRLVRIVDARTGRPLQRLACGRSPVWWDARHVLIEGYDADCDGRAESPG